ncbi:DUF6088 family protein [Herbaspirillum sp. RTI4]|uniref:DUF6088 family protein n=1 Tax=Herbaspirillum sp. RTI4 TaxID=3048640 RepID=UPI002AB3C74F|nr:DUF6088 family protein [Herbaspirillum sp. RTI4]MDY7576729.1 DUF6088 family protein [Herbaspirillum sp. RTI4]MEA9983598.1 DUF6088 family protein [Herbaspirillum sp. RTI4]
MSKMTLEERIEMSLRRSAAKVFLRKEFDRFGGYDQVGRALRSVINKGLLIKAGYGVYVKAKQSTLTGKSIPVVPLIEIGLEVLTKLGVKPDLGASAKEYRDGKTTQMPMSTVLNVGGSRVSRRIGFGSKSIRYEQ